MSPCSFSKMQHLVTDHLAFYAQAHYSSLGSPLVSAAAAARLHRVYIKVKASECAVQSDAFFPPF